MAKKKSKPVETSVEPLPEAPIFFYETMGRFTDSYWEKVKVKEEPVYSELICHIFADDIVQQDILKVEFMNDLGYGEIALQKLRDKAPELEFLVRTGHLRKKKKSNVSLEEQLNVRLECIVQAQLVAAAILAGIGHPAGLPAIISAIEQGNDLYRWAMLVQLYTPVQITSARNERHDLPLLCPPDAGLIQALRNALKKDSHSVWLIFRAATANKFTQLHPDALEHLQSQEPLTAVHAAGAILQLTENPNDVRLVADRLVRLDFTKHQLRQFVWASRSALRKQARDLQPFLIDCIRTICFPYLREQKSLPLLDAIQTIESYYSELFLLFRQEDVGFVTNLIQRWKSPENPHKDNWASAYTTKKYQNVLAYFDPTQKVKVLFSEQDYLESRADEISSPCSAEDVEIILECARRTKRKHKSEDQIFGDKSAHLLWQHCGQAGQAYVLKNLEVFTDEGLRELLCLSEQLDANVAAQTLLQAELTSLSETELITAAQENNCWYLALENQLRASQRCFGDDGEAGTIPPNYAGLIQRFAQNSAGKLDFTHIEQIEPPEERIEEEGSQVTFQFCGEKYTIKTEYSGDWFELTSIEAGLRKILKQHKIGDRFLLSIEHGQCFTYYFAPEKVFAPIAEKFGIRYYDEKGKSPDKTEWRKKIIERIKKAAKSTRR